jgi:DNA-binding Xre family transcriptional regulator
MRVYVYSNYDIDGKVEMDVSDDLTFQDFKSRCSSLLCMIGDVLVYDAEGHKLSSVGII